jgi:hypothetical protein
VWFAIYYREGFGGTVLLRSADHGATFSQRRIVDCPAGQLLAQNRRYTGALWVDPTDPAKLLVGGGSTPQPDPRSVCRSLTGGSGQSFTPIDDGKSFDVHAIVEHPGLLDGLNRTVYIGNDQGLFRIRNYDTTPVVEALNQGLGTQQFHGAVMNPVSGAIMGGTQDLGTLRRAADGTWTQIMSGDGTFTATDPTDPLFWYYGKSIGRVFRSTEGGEDPTTRHCIATSSATSPLGEAAAARGGFTRPSASGSTRGRTQDFTCLTTRGGRGPSPPWGRPGCPSPT